MTLSLLPAVDVAAAERFARCCDLVRLPGRAFPSIELVTALDGSASAKRDGAWLAGCSVPRRAAEFMVRNEKWTARSLCLISPTHGQQIRVLLDRLGPTRALVAVVPSQDDLADMLGSVDLLSPLETGRLYFAWDEASLKAVFDRNPGLAVPQQMVRLPDTDIEAAKAIIAWTQAVLSPVTVEHARRLAAVTQQLPGESRCVLAGGEFRLWNDAGHALREMFGNIIDTHRPTLSSEAAVAEKIASARIIVADRPRPAWLGVGRSWIAWQTTPSVPAFNANHPNDALVLADAAWRPLAEAAGWPGERLAVAGWPRIETVFTPGSAPALLLDLPSLDVPKDCEDITSRRQVWEAIRAELSADPFAIGDDATKYVTRALPRLGLPAEADFPVDRYVQTLVAPAFAVGLARWLAKQGIAFTVHGRGWEKHDDLADRWRGTVADRQAFLDVLADSGGVIDPSLPTPNPAAMALGVPIVSAYRQTPQRVIQSIASLRNGQLPVGQTHTPSILDAIELLTRSNV